MFRTLLLLLLSVSLAHAAETDKTAAAIKDTLQKNYEQLIGPVDQVNKSPIPGLYEVVTGDHIFYTDKTAQYLIDGSMFDLKMRRNLTEARSRVSVRRGLQQIAAGSRDEKSKRQRQPQDGLFHRSELRLLQEAGAGIAERDRRHPVSLPLSHL